MGAKKELDEVVEHLREARKAMLGLMAESDDSKQASLISIHNEIQRLQILLQDVMK